MSTEQSARRERGNGWTARIAAIGLAAAMLVGLTGGPARANRVASNEEVGCDGGEICDVDTFEIKCTQASQRLCIWVRHNSTLDNTLMTSAVVTAPPSMLGQAGMAHIPLDDDRAFCFESPGSAVLIKALLSVTLVPLSTAGQKAYHVEAEYFTGDIINGLNSRRTTMTLPHDE